MFYRIYILYNVNILSIRYTTLTLERMIVGRRLVQVRLFSVSVFPFTAVKIYQVHAPMAKVHSFLTCYAAGVHKFGGKMHSFLSIYTFLLKY